MRYNSFWPLGILTPALAKRVGVRGMMPRRCLAGMFLMSNLVGDSGIFSPLDGTKTDEADGRLRRRREAMATARGGDAMVASDGDAHL